MEQLLPAIAWLGLHYQVIAAAIIGILSGVIAIALLIPGDQPEKSLQWIVDLLSKISRK